jgi:hypothetical protein
MSFRRNISPRGAIGDLLEVWRQPTPYRWPVLGVSIAATIGLGVIFIPESQRIQPRPPEVTYITSFAPDRTDAEIIASNIENQRRKEQRLREIAVAEERVKEAYRQLGRATGLDVEAMERQIAREKAGEEAAARRQAQAGPGNRGAGDL